MLKTASFGGHCPPFKDPWYVYILHCVDGTFYVGCTNDLENRFLKHSRGLVVSTKKRLPVQLIMYHVFGDKYHAFMYEKYLKSGSGRAFTARHFARRSLLR